MEQYYYPKTIRNTTIALLDMFNNIKVEKRNKQGTFIKDINVPITFSPQEKNQKIRLEGESLKKYYLSTPRIAIGLKGISYDSNRAIGINELRFFNDIAIDKNNMEEFYSDYQPTPYNYEYTMFIRTESLTNFSQIMENILPYFNPSLYLRVKEFSFLNIERDLKVTLNGVSPNFENEIPEDSMRMVNADIDISIEGYMYRPITQSKIIKYIHTDYIMNDKSVNTFSTSGIDEISGAPVESEYTYSGDIPGTNDTYYTKVE